MLTWRQYQDGVAAGGIALYLNNTTATNGVLRDTDGDLADVDATMNSWHVRMVDLSQYAGQTLTNFNIFNSTGGAAGNWDIYFGDITLVHTDGTFIPIYSRSMTSLSPFQGPAETALSVITEKVADMTPLTTTTYYHGDHLGSTQLLTAGTGWPVGGDIYYPYGQGPMPGTNHYLFTDKERDAESQLDYFGARYYASNMGRFMSPDWSAQEEPVPYAKLNDPQSLNLYSYVLNHPLVGIDPDGHACDDANEMAVCHGITVAISNGMNAGDALQAGQQALQPLSNASENAIQNSNLTSTQASAFEGAVSNAGAANLINPNLLVGLAYKESSLDPTAVNDGARGLYQIRRKRQQDLGLSDADVTSVDAVVDPVAKYLSHTSSVLGGNIDLTLGSWRQGIKGISQLNAKGPNAVSDFVISPAAHGRPAQLLGKDYIDVIKSYF